MYQAIVVLPLLGAIVAGLIALAGARARVPGEDPPPPGEHPAAPHAESRGHEAALASAAHGDAHSAGAHGEDEGREPSAAGSLLAELVTCTFLVITCVLSWIDFLGEQPWFGVP